MTSFVKKTSQKDVVGMVTFDLIGLLSTNHIIAYIICEEMFDINSKIAQTRKNSTVRKSIPQEMANHGDYPQDFRF